MNKTLDDIADEIALKTFQEMEFVLHKAIKQLVDLGNKEGIDLDGLGIIVHSGSLDAFKLLVIQQKNKFLDLIKKTKSEHGWKEMEKELKEALEEEIKEITLMINILLGMENYIKYMWLVIRLRTSKKNLQLLISR